jgi:hypothetical protein
MKFTPIQRYAIFKIISNNLVQVYFEKDKIILPIKTYNEIIDLIENELNQPEKIN